jgi:hypothetical protein
MKEAADFERMVAIRGRHLYDAINAIPELIYLIEHHPKTYREMWREGHPNREVQQRKLDLASLLTLFEHTIEEPTPRDLDRMVTIRARHLDDAREALNELACLIEWQAEHYRELRKYSYPQLEIPRRISEVCWLKFVFEETVQDKQEEVRRLERIKEEGLASVQPSELYSCDGTHPYREGFPPD